MIKVGANKDLNQIQPFFTPFSQHCRLPGAPKNQRGACSPSWRRGLGPGREQRRPRKPGCLTAALCILVLGCPLS